MVSDKNQSAEAGMMIRKPAADVYQAFTDPAITTNFWFTKSTGKLEQNATVTWTWEMYGVSTEVKVLSLEPYKKINILWGGASEQTSVEWTFTALDESRTYVMVRNFGFKGSLDEIIAQVKDSTGGFTTVLDGLKGYLEHGIRLNLVADKFPKELGKPGE